jgi:hypothetical protein
VWDNNEHHIKILCPGNHAKGLADQMSVENLRDGDYVLFTDQIRAFRKLRSKERVEACVKYLVYRFPKVYERVPGTRNAVQIILHKPEVVRPKKDQAEREFLVRVPCRVINHYTMRDEPMDLDIPVEADNSYEATRHVELTLRELLKKGPI